MIKKYFLTEEPLIKAHKFDQKHIDMMMQFMTPCIRQGKYDQNYLGWVKERYLRLNFRKIREIKHREKYVEFQDFQNRPLFETLKWLKFGTLQ